jgi:hypothetical protein
MPANHVNDPKHWHDRAAEMRAIAETMKEPDAKEMLLRLALDCEKLAERANGIMPS